MPPSRLAGATRRRFSPASEAAVYWAIMKPEEMPLLRARNGGRPLTSGFTSRSMRRSEIAATSATATAEDPACADRRVSSTPERDIALRASHNRMATASLRQSCVTSLTNMTRSGPSGHVWQSWRLADQPGLVLCCRTHSGRGRRFHCLTRGGLWPLCSLQETKGALDGRYLGAQRSFVKRGGNDWTGGGKPKFVICCAYAWFAQGKRTLLCMSSKGHGNGSINGRSAPDASLRAERMKSGRSRQECSES